MPDDPLSNFIAPITTAFSQQFKEMFGTLNEYIAASIPSVQYFKSVTESFKIQETLARSSLDYSKALDFLTGQLDRVEGSRLENMKEVVANFEAGIRTTGDDLLTLQSELRRTGVDTQLSRKVFSELYGITGGNVQSQNMLAKVVRDTSKSQLVSMDTLVKALDSVSDEMRTTSIIAGDPTRVDRITTAMAGMAASLPEGMRSELLKFIMSTENYSNRLMTGTEDIVQAIKTETDVAKLPALLEQLYSQLGSSLDSLTSGSDEFTKTLVLERLGLGALYASQSTVQKLVEEQKRTGKASLDGFAKSAADTDAVNKTMKSVLEAERRKTAAPGGMDELTGMREAVQLTTGALNSLGAVVGIVEPAFKGIANALRGGIKGQAEVFQAPKAGLDPLAIQTGQEYKKVIDDLTEGRQKILILNEQYRSGAIDLTKFNQEIAKASDELNKSYTSRSNKIISDLESSFETLSENLERSHDSLAQFNEDVKAGITPGGGYTFYDPKEENRFFNEAILAKVKFNEEQIKSFKDIFLQAQKTAKKIETTEPQANQVVALIKLNEQTQQLINTKINDLVEFSKNQSEKIDTVEERKKLAKDYSDDLYRRVADFIEITTEAQRTQKLNNKNIEDIARVLKSHATLLEGIVKVPGIGDNLMIGVGASLLSQREPQ